jgi:hypothetical protein
MSTSGAVQDEQLVSQVHAAEAERCAAMVAADVSALDRLLGEELLYGHTGGARDSKADYLGKFRAGELRYPTMSSTPVAAKVYGDTVLLWIESRGSVITPVMTKDMHSRTLCVWQRRGDAVVLVAHQPTVMPL